MQLIEIDLKKCNKSFACIRACPVKAITTGNDDMPFINHARCIGCGSCLSVCAQGAVTHISSVDETLKILKSKDKVAAIVDPSISGEFSDITDYRKFVEMIRKLGFSYVNEVSFGVDIIARKYNELINNFKGKYYITSNCPSVVAYVEKYMPELVDNLSPFVNPMTATAKIVRKLYGQDLKVVFIGPCVSAKAEATRFDDDGKVDSVLTFVELRELFEKTDIKEAKVEYSDFDKPIGYLGSLYPVSEGFVFAAELDAHLLTSSIITTDGKDNMINALEEFSTSTEFIKKHFNLFYNEGCLMGPGTSESSKKFLRRSLVVDYANKRLKDFNKKQWEDNIKKFSEIDFKRAFIKEDLRKETPPVEVVEEIMKSLGKNMEEKSACGACGYRTCKEFAVSISQKLSKPEHCLNYSLKTKQDYIKTLKTNNERIKKQFSDLQGSDKELQNEFQRTKIAFETTSALLQNLPSAAVIVDEKLKVIESNQSFINILGEDAEMINEVIPGLKGADLKTLLPHNIYNLFSYVLENDENIVSRDVSHNEALLNISIYSLKPGKIAGAVFRDMYVAEVRQEEIMNRVTEVIDENLKMVQNIAFSLGEGASNTEKMLNSIIETYKKIKSPDKE